MVLSDLFADAFSDSELENLTKPEWTEWSAESTPAERVTAEMFLSLNVGDSIKVELHGIPDASWHVYHINESPGCTRIYIEVPNYGARPLVYVVRERYVFIVDEDNDFPIVQEFSPDSPPLFTEDHIVRADDS